MLMPVVNIREVRMLVSQDGMLVPVRMPIRGIARKRDFVHVLVMLVMPVTMFVGRCFVRVVMCVMFGQMQPHSQRH